MNCPICGFLLLPRTSICSENFNPKNRDHYFQLDCGIPGQIKYNLECYDKLTLSSIEEENLSLLRVNIDKKMKPIPAHEFISLDVFKYILNLVDLKLSDKTDLLKRLDKLVNGRLAKGPLF